MNDVPLVAPDSLARRLAAGEHLTLLDTRSATAHAAFPFEAPAGARLVNLPGDALLADPAGAAAGLGRPAAAGAIVAFCSRGNSSRDVARALRRAGYDAASLEGGVLRWSERIVATPVAGGEALAHGAALIQLRRLGKGCLGYAVIGGGRALVVDAGRDVEPALAAVRGLGARVARVLDTHLHADHVSGGPALARATRVPYGLPPGDAAGITFDAEPVNDGATWQLDGVEVRAIHTPGHTDGSTSYLVGGRFLLTGDTLFVAGIGRPDLSGQGERLARVLHRTLTDVVARLPDDVVVLPAHIATPRELGPAGVACARLGDLKARTLAALPRDPDAFARAVLAALPPQPPNYESIRAANRGAVPSDPAELEFGPNRCAVPGV
jgi:glyoxylase-like metal-dependent hydrolase (beta-lactamase superfamily II)/rhodanese-related sulfurtransferase